MKALSILSIGMVASLCLAVPALAGTYYGTVSAKILSVGPDLYMASMVQPYDISWYTGATGQFNLQLTGALVGTLSLQGAASCIETQTISVGSTYTYDVVDVYDVPAPRGPADQGKGPMGVVKGDYLRELWARSFTSVTGNVTAAAFQLAVWEIVFEDLPVTNWDVTVGKFKAKTGSGAAPDAAIALANSWLGQVDGTGPKARLYGLRNSSRQDFIVASAPEPATLVLMGTGGLLLLVRRRRAR